MPESTDKNVEPIESTQTHTTHPSPPTLGLADEQLALVMEELAGRMQRGEAVDVEAYARQYPSFAQQIRQLAPAAAALAALGEAVLGSGPGAAEVLPPQAIGDFRLIREIARGGMGVVYEAEQLSLARRVALKVLPFAGVLDQRALARFKVEAQAAAQLHHGNIVPVYAVGSERGVHYYAMQLVDGQSLASVVRELRQQAGLEPEQPADLIRPPEQLSQITRGLTSGQWGISQPDPLNGQAPPSVPASTGSTRTRGYFRQIAQLGIQAAEALEHAHLHGVIHRDVKPSNLIVDADGKLWVTDFGLASFRHGDSDQNLTLPGDLLGTARYMSPEQAWAKRRVPVDHRTDVYSLGVTLYELLALRPAFDAPDRQELLQKIAEEQPTPLRRLNPKLPVDLETVVLKAMGKDPFERYGTAKELAEDLERFLADQPIKARRPAVLQRMGRWRRRHKPLVWAAGIIVLLAGVGLLIGSAMLWREQQRTAAALRQSQDNGQRAERERARAEDNLVLAMDTLDRMYDRLRELSEPKGSVDSRILDLGIRFNEQVAAENQGSALALERTAQSLATQWQKGTGHPAQRRRLVRQEVAQRRQLLATPGQDGDRRRRELAEALVRLFVVGSNSEWNSAWAESLSITQDLEARHPADKQVLALVAYTGNWASDRLLNVGRSEEAVEQLRRTIRALQALAAPPHNEDQRRGLGWGHLFLGSALGELGRWPEAEEAARQSLGHYQSLIAEDPLSLQVRQRVCEARRCLVEALRGQGRYEEALRELETLLPEWERLAAIAPGGDWSVGEAVYMLAEIHCRLGQAEQAAVAYERARQAHASAMAREHKGVGAYAYAWCQVQWCVSTCALAEVLERIPSRRGEAEPLYREVLAASDPLMKQGLRNVLLPHARSWAYVELGDWQAAVRDLAAYSRAAPNDFHTRYRHALACLGMGDRDAYRAVCRDAVEHLESATQGNGGVRIVWACLLAPDSGIDPSDLAKRAGPLLSSDSRNCNVLLARGALLYRTGRYEELARLWAGCDRPGTPVDEVARSFTSGHLWYFMAMACHRSGEAAEARRWLQLADGDTDQRLRGSRGPVGWWDRVQLEQLRKEAKATLAGPATAPATLPVAETR